MKRNGDGTGNGEWETIVGVEVGVEVGNWKSLIGRQVCSEARLD